MIVLKKTKERILGCILFPFSILKISFTSFWLAKFVDRSAAHWFILPCLLRTTPTPKAPPPLLSGFFSCLCILWLWLWCAWVMVSFCWIYWEFSVLSISVSVSFLGLEKFTQFVQIILLSPFLSLHLLSLLWYECYCFNKWLSSLSLPLWSITFLVFKASTWDCISVIAFLTLAWLDFSSFISTGRDSLVFFCALFQPSCYLYNHCFKL